MLTKLILTLLAGAFALVSATAPAEARSGRDNRNLIAGLAVGAIIGAAIASNNKKRKHQGGHVSRGHQDAYRSGHHRGHRGGHAGDHNRGYGHDDGYRGKRVNLPGACRVHKGHSAGYSGRCLGGYNFGHSALPSACAVRVGGHHGTIYRDNCLNRYGYH